MHFRLNSGSLEESNLLLRALWAQLRRHFGTLAWNYVPAKHGVRRAIVLGWADLGLTAPVEVELTYGKRGILDGIKFDAPKRHRLDLQHCIDSAVVAARTPPQFDISTEATVLPALSFATRGTTGFILAPVRRGLIAISATVKAFDRTDAEAEFVRRVRSCLDVLSVFTNALFLLRSGSTDNLSESYAAATTIQSKEHSSEEPANNPTPDYSDSSGTFDPDWLDGYPLVNGHVFLEDSCIKTVHHILTDDQQHGWAKLVMDAGHHFQAARLTEIRRHVDRVGMSLEEEQAIVFYCSALEVASMIDAPAVTQCSQCGQPQYTIGARVKTLVTKHLGTLVGRQVKGHYDTRSKYLHRGALLSSRSYVSTSIPQLDPGSPSGVSAQVAGLTAINLREYTSYCIRRCVREKAAELSVAPDGLLAAGPALPGPYGADGRR